MRPFLIALTLFSLLSCESRTQPTGGASSYSYACLDSTVTGGRVGKGLGKAGDYLRDLAVDEASITDAVQNQYGAAFHQDVVEAKTFQLLPNAPFQAQLDRVLSDLLKVRQQPSAIDYHIYAVDDSAINAFTFGGRIYVTKAMYDKCAAEPALLYAIVGHEIGHSEKGHTRKTIQEMMLANKVFGEDNGATALQIKRLLTGAFNQRNELEADYYGTDLTYRLNQDICSAVRFWKGMSEMENSYNRLEDFFRTHPFSSLRAQCLSDHIKRNFGLACTEAGKLSGESAR